MKVFDPVHASRVSQNCATAQRTKARSTAKKPSIALQSHRIAIRRIVVVTRLLAVFVGIA